jgi:hypothetical protein
MDPQAKGGWARARMEAAKTTIKSAVAVARRSAVDMGFSIDLCAQLGAKSVG